MIYLVRHGQTDWNLAHKIQGHEDIPLNETGLNEAKICGRKLASVKIGRIIASDLLRAGQTAGVINDFLSVQISFDKRLRETNLGDLQGRVAEEISQAEWDVFNNEPHKIHAESLEDVYHRVKSFFDEIDVTQNTLVVTHAGVVRMARYLMENPHSFNWTVYKEKALPFQIKNTEIFEWDKKKLFVPLQKGIER